MHLQVLHRTAIPSGTLWRVTAKTSIVVLFNLKVLIPFSTLFSKCGTITSIIIKKIIPNIKPIVAGIQPITPCSSAISIAGIIKDQTEAAIITPEANPNNVFSTLGFI